MIKSELDVLRDVSQRLESAGIAFMLTGSVAMNYYAQPRMTRDIDLVVELTPAHAESFMRKFGADYYLDRGAVMNAIRERSMFNLIHDETIIKIDCIMLKSEAYRREEFARRKQVDLGDFQTWIVSREDLILSKLYWAKDSKSELQLRDVKNLLASKCDSDYLHTRAPASWVGSSVDGGAGFMMDETPPEITELVRERLLALSGAERVLIGSRMFDAARAIVLASFPKGLSEIEIKARLCERLYGSEVEVQPFVKHLHSLRSSEG